MDSCCSQLRLALLDLGSWLENRMEYMSEVKCLRVHKRNVCPVMQKDSEDEVKKTCFGKEMFYSDIRVGPNSSEKGIQ